eukprot:TRINITY_DN375_c0_g2_i1.p1 TRINITY_DN375_c0_g2~~TRINITY_DN375_c0_g2_i1.p1  ORF type:complete len:1031 (-),score=222.49 TRINITY_DN375_c0_g2_i1:26-2911(-)
MQQQHVSWHSVHFEKTDHLIKPPCRGWHTLTPLDENAFLLFGGRNELGLCGDLYLLDAVKWAWTRPLLNGTAPCKRYQHTATLADRDLYVVGGFDTRFLLGDVFTLNIDRLEWKSIEKRGTFDARAGHTTNFVDNKLYVVGGKVRDGKYANDVSIFDIATQTWVRPSVGGTAPSPRAFHSTVTVGTYLYVFGGRTDVAVHKDLFMFDTLTASWSKVSCSGSAPSARYGHSAVLLEEKYVVLFGGSSPTTQFGETFAFDTENKSWHNLKCISPLTKAMPVPSSQHTAVVGSGSKMYIFAGVRQQFTKAKRDIRIHTTYLEDLLILYHFDKALHDLNDARPNKPRFGGALGRALSQRSSDDDGKVINSPKRVRSKQKDGMFARAFTSLGGRKGEKGEGGLSAVGLPMRVVHKVHIDQDFNWTGGDPDEVFRLEHKLGEGAFGSVYRASLRATDAVFAIKMISGDGIDHEEIEKEIEILKQCSHANVVGYYGTAKKDNALWILMDFCALGSIKDMMDTTQITLTEQEIAVVCAQSLRGLVYLHAMNVIHRDVKAANILLTEDGQVKIADFGVSEQLSDASADTEGIAGSPYWMAPEVSMKKPWDGKADVWSLGITVIELAEGHPPNHDIHPMIAMRMVISHDPPTLENEAAWGEDMKDFVAKCLVKDPNDRPDAIELMMHPFVTGTPKSALEPLIRQCLDTQIQKQAFSSASITPRDDDGDHDPFEDGAGAGANVHRPTPASAVAVKPAAVILHPVVDADSSTEDEDMNAGIVSYFGRCSSEEEEASPRKRTSSAKLLALHSMASGDLPLLRPKPPFGRRPSPVSVASDPHIKLPPSLVSRMEDNRSLSLNDLGHTNGNSPETARDSMSPRDAEELDESQVRHLLRLQDGGFGSPRDEEDYGALERLITLSCQTLTASMASQCMGMKERGASEEEVTRVVAELERLVGEKMRELEMALSSVNTG